MKKSILLMLLCLPCLLWSQDPDYVMWKVTYLQPKPGHYGQLMQKLAEHNQQYHKEGPQSAYVATVLTGPNSGKLRWVMGPCTYSDLDKMSDDRVHYLDWYDGVMSHCETGVTTTEFLVRQDELSHFAPANGVSRPLRRARYFEVVDNALFQEVQKMVAEVIAKTPEMAKYSRVMFRRRFMQADQWNWVMTTSRENWAALDADSPDITFREAFEKVHGKEAWEPAVEKFQKSIKNRQDQWLQTMPELSGPQPAAAAGNN